jgi:ribosomal protein L37AE/L43A
MAYKFCSECKQASYSAAHRIIWYCPYCGNELTFSKGYSEKFFPETITGKNKPQLRLLDYHSRSPSILL